MQRIKQIIVSGLVALACALAPGVLPGLGLISQAPQAHAATVPFRSVQLQRGEVTPYDFSAYFSGIGTPLDSGNDSAAFNTMLGALSAGTAPISDNVSRLVAGAHFIIGPRDDGQPWRIVNVTIPSHVEVECVGGAQIRPPVTTPVPGPIFIIGGSTSSGTQFAKIRNCLLDGDKAKMYQYAVNHGQDVVVNSGIKELVSTVSPGPYQSPTPLSTFVGDPRNAVIGVDMANFVGQCLIAQGRGGFIAMDWNCAQSDGQPSGDDANDVTSPAVYINTYDSQFIGFDIGGNSGTGMHCVAQFCAENTLSGKIWGNGNGVAQYTGATVHAATGNQLIKISTAMLDSPMPCNGGGNCPLSEIAYYFNGSSHTIWNGATINPSGADYVTPVTGGCSNHSKFGATCLSGPERRMAEYVYIYGDFGDGQTNQGQLPAALDGVLGPTVGWAYNPGYCNLIVDGNLNRFIGMRLQDSYFANLCVSGNGNHFEGLLDHAGYHPLNWYSHRSELEIDGGAQFDTYLITEDDPSPAVSEFAVQVVGNDGSPTGQTIWLSPHNLQQTNTGGLGSASLAKTAVDAKGNSFEGTATFNAAGNDGDTLTVGSIAYVANSVLTGAAAQFEIGDTAAHSATNFKTCLNGSGTQVASFSAYISGTTLNITSAITGAVASSGSNALLSAPGLAPQTSTTAKVDGVTYTVNNSQTLGSIGSPVAFTQGNGASTACVKRTELDWSGSTAIVLDQYGVQVAAEALATTSGGRFSVSGATFAATTPLTFGNLVPDASGATALYNPSDTTAPNTFNNSGATSWKRNRIYINGYAPSGF